MIGRSVDGGMWAIGDLIKDREIIRTDCRMLQRALQSDRNERELKKWEEFEEGGRIVWLASLWRGD